MFAHGNRGSSSLGRMHAIIQLICNARDSGRLQTRAEKTAVGYNHFTTKLLGYSTNDNTRIQLLLLLAGTVC